MEKNESSFTPNTKKLVSGFTLLELIIVVIIITTFVGLSIANYNRFNEEKKLEEQTKQLIDVLDLASKKASSGDIPTSCSSFEGYEVQTTASSYSFYRCCDGNCTLVRTYTLPTNFSLSVRTVRFKPLSRGTDLINNATLKIKNSFISKCIDITVSPAGIVSEGNKYTGGC